MGPQDDAFTEAGIGAFLSATYTVTPRFDRMGYRLQGPVIEHKLAADIISDGTPRGAVQVTGDGMPIVLLADCGTTGGYTKIAIVISVDLPKIGQAQPGDTVTFRSVGLEDAHRALRDQEELLETLRS
jgi:allophanate hydrolase subunit 2